MTTNMPAVKRPYGPFPLTKFRAKDRIKGHWYYYYSKGELELRYCTDGKRIREMDKLKEFQKQYKKEHEEDNKEYQKQYRETHKEELKITAKEYYETHQEYCKEYQKQYRETHQEDCKEYQKQYRETHQEDNKEYQKQYHEKMKNYPNYIQTRNQYTETHKEEKKIRDKKYHQTHKKERCERDKERRKNDPYFRLLCNLGANVHGMLRRQGASKNARTIEYSCCSVAFLYAHLEKQFIDGMNWDNWSIHGWHIDHRRPKASFNLNDEDEIYMCQHYTNLQPMWGPENIAKGAKFDPETFEYVWKGRAIGWRLKKFDVVFTKLKEEIIND